MSFHDVATAFIETLSQGWDWLAQWLCPLDAASDAVLERVDPFLWRPRKRVAFHPLVIVRPYRRDSRKPMRPTPRRSMTRVHTRPNRVPRTS